ncbi:hypothetical protein BO99DRAFT_127974 [Aspergillus violaceofuscus CBS 115571]|uniref:Uncharacterized protein n=1 Tax=Aspergillus violaceofuscus (strain CBS 115571) TaxID=1450538 RepID=A0A2V5HKA3_ASPV1|nr:hypothetical protein BO99DRAFT_127974 [Aspergillus violaceofuscus CBS 115571]
MRRDVVRVGLRQAKRALTWLQTCHQLMLTERALEASILVRKDLMLDSIVKGVILLIWFPAAFISADVRTEIA